MDAQVDVAGLLQTQIGRQMIESFADDWTRKGQRELRAWEFNR